MEPSRKQNSRQQGRKPKKGTNKAKFKTVTRNKHASDPLDMQELNYSVQNLSTSSETDDSDCSGIMLNQIDLI